MSLFLFEVLDICILRSTRVEAKFLNRNPIDALHNTAARANFMQSS